MNRKPQSVLVVVVCILSLLAWAHVGAQEPRVGDAFQIGEQGQPASPTKRERALASTPTPFVFPLAKIESLRKAGQQVREMREEMLQRIPPGWSKCMLDPMKLLPHFKTLKLKSGYVLRAYQFQEEGNGNGVVWAIPVGTAFPDPNELLGDRFELFKAPKPSKALDNFMEAIDGDRSAWSFMEASLLDRELKEFGALWHGMKWDWQSILAEDPWTTTAVKNPGEELEPAELEFPDVNAKWTWHVAKPTDWRPTLTVNGDVVTITFYAYSPLYKAAILRHVDEFRPGEYRFTTETTKMATAEYGFAP